MEGLEPDHGEHWYGCLVLDEEGRALLGSDGAMPCVRCENEEDTADIPSLRACVRKAGVEIAEMAHVLYWVDGSTGHAIDIYVARAPKGSKGEGDFCFLDLGLRVQSAQCRDTPKESAFWGAVVTALAAHWCSP